MIKIPMMRALLLAACLILSACGSPEPEPPPPPDPAVLAAQRRAQGDSLIRARREELAAMRERRELEEHSVADDLRRSSERNRAEAARKAEESYQRCLRSWVHDRSVNCSNLRPGPSARRSVTRLEPLEASNGGQNP